MKRTILVVLAVVAIAASIGFATVATAAAATAPEQNARGVGTVTAQGDGVALLGGKGTVDLTGNGILWVNDKGGNATIEVTGYGEKEEFPDGWIQYSGFNGSAHIEGKRIVVMVAGVDVELTAQGHGRVLLWGHGTCEINGITGEWVSALGPAWRAAHRGVY